jgi:hypothetical protein
MKNYLFGRRHKMTRKHKKLEIIVRFVILIVGLMAVLFTKTSVSDDRLKLPDRIPARVFEATDEFWFKAFLEDENKNDSLDLLHDHFAWKTFLTLNLPEPPIWTQWKTDYEVFRLDGIPPTDWKTPKSFPNHPFFANAREVYESITQEGIPPEQVRVLFNFDVIHSDDVSVRQAAKEKVWDQNGNPVYYEVLIGESSFNSIQFYQLYSKDWQIAKGRDRNYRDRTWFELETQLPDEEIGPGAINLKLAWKIIATDKENPTRYFTQEAVIIETDGTAKRETVGLVGLHLTQKANQSGIKWIWATFEHADNLEIEEDYVGLSYYGNPLQPSFYDPDCTDCEENVPPPADANGVKRTQITRALKSLPSDVTKKANDKWKSRLKEERSPWQFYRLVGTQREYGKERTPTKLTNPVMETYEQDTSCMDCHENSLVVMDYSKSGSADFTFLLGKGQWWNHLGDGAQFYIESASSIIAGLPEKPEDGKKDVGEELRSQFKTNFSTDLSANAKVEQTVNPWWLLTDTDEQYIIDREAVPGQLYIFKVSARDMFIEFLRQYDSSK